MSNPPNQPQPRARVSAQANLDLRPLQQALLESVRLFTRDVRRCAHDWQTRWNNPQLTPELAEIGDALLVALAGLEAEFSEAEGPSRPHVARFLTALLGTCDAEGHLPRLQRVANQQAAMPSVDNQRLLSEVDSLSLQLDGLRAQWRDYLALAMTLERRAAYHDPEPLLPPLPPNPTNHPPTAVLPPLPMAQAAPPDDEEEEAAVLPPRAAAAQRVNAPTPPGRQGWGQLLGRVTWPQALTILLVLVLILVLVSSILNHFLSTAARIPPAALSTSAGQQTPTIPPASAGSTARPATPTPAPPQLSVSPLSLLLPCPGSGEATLHLANTGQAPLSWQITVVSASGGDPGILLDGEQTRNGSLNPGQTTQISVTAQLNTARGSLSISYTGVAAPIMVPYSLNC